MAKQSFQRNAVFVMALYNIVVGAVVFFLYKQIFRMFGIAPPVNAPTIQIPCLFLVVFGIGYLYAAHDLVRNRALLLVGLLQNAAVIGIVVWYKIHPPENAPKLINNMYLIPAGLSALFAITFLIALFGSMIEGGRQRRRRKTAEAGPIRVKAARFEAAPAPQETAPEPVEQTQGPTEPEEDSPFGPLADRDRSGIHTDEPPPPESA